MRLLASLTFVVGACSGGGGAPPASCPDGGSCPSSDNAPRILTLAANTTVLDERDTLSITAVVTDPDGVADLIGGTLLDPATQAAYGAFAASAAEGAYELKLAWADLEAVRPIDTPIGGASRDFTARFFDQAGHTADATVSVTLHCSQSGYALCSGTCTDLAADPDNCGACGHVIAAGSACQGGAGCVLGPENTVAACTDGCSNDGDAYIDCNDYDCCSVVDCPSGTACRP